MKFRRGRSHFFNGVLSRIREVLVTDSRSTCGRVREELVTEFKNYLWQIGAIMCHKDDDNSVNDSGRNLFQGT